MKFLILLAGFYSTNISAMDLSQLTKIDVAEKCSTKKIIKALPSNLTQRIKYSKILARKLYLTFRRFRNENLIIDLFT